MEERRQDEQTTTSPEWWWDPDAGPEYLVLPEPGEGRPDRTVSLQRREAEVDSIAVRVERLEGLATRNASQVSMIREEIGALAAEVRDALGSLSEAVDRVRLDGARSAREAGDRTRELAAAVETARAEAVAHTNAVRADLDERTAGIRMGQQEAHASLLQAVRDASADLTMGLRAAAQAVEAAIAEAARTMGEEHASTMERYSKEFAVALRPVAEGLARVERLGASIEAMRKRRGFQELVRSEQTLREEQSAFVRTLSDASGDLAVRVAGLTELVGQLEERLVRAGQDADALKQLPAQATERVAAAVERLRGELTTVMEDRFGEQVSLSVDRLKMELESGLPVQEAITRLRDLPRTQEDLARTQRSIDGGVVSLRAEIRSLEDRIQGWGKPRTAPRLAQDVEAIATRLEAVEGELQGALADRVAQVVTERVLDAVQGPDGAKRRGLRRRS